MDAIRYRRDAKGRRRPRPYPEQLFILQMIAVLLFAPLMVACLYVIRSPH